MSDDVERLARFTPTAGTLDRDEVLFRAGRASVRTPRGWKLACGVLAVTQVATVAAGLVRLGRPDPAPVQAPTPVVPQQATVIPAEPPPTPSKTIDPLSHLALSRRWYGDALPLPPAPSGPAASKAAVPLTAGSRGDMLN